MTDEQRRAAAIECERVRELLERAVQDVRETGGDIDWFSRFLLRAALETHLALNGKDELERVVSSLGVEYLSQSDGAGRD